MLRSLADLDDTPWLGETHFNTAPQANPKHSSATSAWYTPVEVVESARFVLGTIDLDPASCYDANQVVKATKFYTKEDDGLCQPWTGRIFCNPPGGKEGNKSLTKMFWQKLLESPEVTEAVFLAFSIEMLQTTQLGCNEPATDYAICIPKRRLQFTDKDGNVVKGNTHASAIIYKGSNTDLFAITFQQIGAIVKPYV